MKTKQPLTRLALGGMLMALVSTLVVDAQTTSNSEEDNIETLETMVSVGFGSSLAQSIEEKREANQVIDTINSEEMGQFPDQNVSEAIQRITGVSITRTNGEGEKVSVRGLSPNFTRVELDGRSSMVTADDNAPERDAQMSVFSSDLISSIEVVKSPTAADVEGGVGGIVRLNTKDPLDFGGLTWAANGTYTWSKYKDDPQYKLNALYGNTFNNGTMGILVGITHEDRDRRVDKIEGNGFLLVEDELRNFPAELGSSAFNARSRFDIRAGDNPRTNLNVNFQWMINPELEFFTKSYFTREQRDEERARLQLTWDRNGVDLASGTASADGTLLAGEFSRHRTEMDTRFRDTEVDSNTIGGGLEWDNGTWTVRGEYSFSDGAEDFLEARARFRENRDGASTYDYTQDFRRPLLDSPTFDLALSDMPLQDLSQQKRIISYEENVFTLDADRETEWGFITSVAAGVRWSDTQFVRRQGRETAPLQKPNGDDITFADGDNNWAFGKGEPFGFGQGPEGFLQEWQVVNPISLLDQYPLSNPITFNDGNFYDVVEETLAGYLMANFDNQSDNVSVRGNFGVRVVNTKVDGIGRTSILYTPGGVDTTIDDFSSPLNTDYTKALPSFNIVVSPANTNFLFRGAITQAMTRPRIREMAPSASIDADDAEIETGNPGLDPFMAWQYDLGFEYYFGDAGQGMFSVNGFHKDVENFVTASTFMETYEFPELGIPAQEYTVSTFVNGGDASITGVEVSLQSTFNLPGAFSGLGGMVNYTYIDSEFTDASGLTLSFPGTSENTYNAILFYDYEGFSARLAYNYRDDFLQEPSGTGVNNRFTEGAGRLDLGLRYRFANGLKITFDAINLTEEQQYRYYDILERQDQLEFEGVIYTLGVGYTF